MAQITVKTPYYYELMREVQENWRNLFSFLHKFPPSPVPNEEISPMRTPIPKLEEVKKTHGMISNLFQGLLLVFAKKASGSFPLAKICFKNGELSGLEFYIYNINPPGNPAGYIIIGRENTQKERFFITLSQQTVSRTHAKIVFFKEELFVVNYSIVNPTQINGWDIPVNRSVLLPAGAIISVGGVEFIVEKIKS